MKYFKLPDLGEGLQEAEIVRWHVKVGDTVKADQLLVSVETAKALVDIPAPYDGVVAKTFGGEGDILHVGEPLLGYEGEADAGTVVGRLEGGGTNQEDAFFSSALRLRLVSIWRTVPRRRCVNWLGNSVLN